MCEPSCGYAGHSPGGILGRAPGGLRGRACICSVLDSHVGGILISRHFVFPQLTHNSVCLPLPRPRASGGPVYCSVRERLTRPAPASSRAPNWRTSTSCRIQGMSFYKDVFPCQPVNPRIAQVGCPQSHVAVSTQNGTSAN